jgi:hypothetical protein
MWQAIHFFCQKDIESNLKKGDVIWLRRMSAS